MAAMRKTSSGLARGGLYLVVADDETKALLDQDLDISMKEFRKIVTGVSDVVRRVAHHPVAISLKIHDWRR